jgi:hypothetical protein
MEGKCPYCGITQEEREQLMDKDIFRICVDCLDDKGLLVQLNQFLWRHESMA